MSRFDYVAVNDGAMTSVAKSEKQLLIDEITLQDKACGELRIKYDADYAECLVEVLVQEGAKVDALRKKAHDLRKENEIAASKMAMMQVCLGALRGEKTFSDIETQAAEERKKPYNYTIAKPWSFSRFWSNVGAQPQTGTEALIEKVKKFINPEYAAACTAKPIVVDDNALGAALFCAMDDLRH